jgi:hypothetical protein
MAMRWVEQADRKNSNKNRPMRFEFIDLHDNRSGSGQQAGAAIKGELTLKFRIAMLAPTST